MPQYIRDQLEGVQTIKRIDLAQKIAFVMSSPWLFTYIVNIVMSSKHLRCKPDYFTFPEAFKFHLVTLFETFYQDVSERQAN